MTNLYRNYWATAPSAIKGEVDSRPRADFQTVWVQRQLQRIAARNEALRAQYIQSNEITG